MRGRLSALSEWYDAPLAEILLLPVCACPSFPHHESEQAESFVQSHFGQLELDADAADSLVRAGVAIFQSRLHSDIVLRSSAA